MFFQYFQPISVTFYLLFGSINSSHSQPTEDLNWMWDYTTDVEGVAGFQHDTWPALTWQERHEGLSPLAISVIAVFQNCAWTAKQRALFCGHSKGIFFLFCFFYKGLQIYFCIFHYKLKFCYFSPASPFPTLVLAKLRAVFVDFGFNDQWGYKTKDLKCFLLLNSSAEIIKIWIVRVAYSQHWLAKTIKVACVMLHCCIVGIIKLIHSFRLCK